MKYKEVLSIIFLPLRSSREVSHSFYFRPKEIASTFATLQQSSRLANQQKNITLLIYCYELEPRVIVWSDFDCLQEHLVNKSNFSITSVFGRRLFVNCMSLLRFTRPTYQKDKQPETASEITYFPTI